MTMPKLFWKLTIYSWGWDFGPVFGYWFVWSRAESKRHVYISSDATPPNSDFNRGFTISHRYR